MNETFDLLIHGGTVATPNGIAPADVGVIAGRIAAIGSLSNAKAVERFEAKGLHVLPGVMDSQVHFREPGNAHKETWPAEVWRRSWAGHRVFEMPNTNPPTTTARDRRQAFARQGAECIATMPYVGATPQNIGAWANWKMPGVCGIKAFLGSSTGTLLLNKEERYLAALKSGGAESRCIPNEDRMIARKHLAMRGKPETHPVWRDAEAARVSTERVLRLAREAGRRLHVLHITTGDEIPLLAAAKDLATAETTPQHLTLSAPECYERLGTYAQMNPPIRDESHRQAIWQAVREGVIDVIGSDHAPHTREEKDKTYPDTPSGMPGVQTLATILLDHVNKGNLTLERFIDLPPPLQRIFGIAGGLHRRGYDADFTIADLVDPRSRIGSPPAVDAFDGMKTTGWPVASMLRCAPCHPARLCRLQHPATPPGAVRMGTLDPARPERPPMNYVALRRGDGSDCGVPIGLVNLPYPAHFRLGRSTASSPAGRRPRWGVRRVTGFGLTWAPS